MAYGHGRLTCQHYLVARREAAKGGYLELNYFRQWFAGYMSGYNHYQLEGTDAVAAAGDETRIESMLDEQCTSNQQQSFASAATIIIDRLNKKRQ